MIKVNVAEKPFVAENNNLYATASMEQLVFASNPMKYWWIHDSQTLDLIHINWTQKDKTPSLLLKTDLIAVGNTHE